MRAVVAGSRWKLALCDTCARRRMMPAENKMCLFCVEKLPEETIKRPPSVEVPNLKALRETRGFSVSELARRAGIDYTTVMRLEERAATANPQRAHHKTVHKLAAALGVEVGELSGCLRRAA